MAYQELTSVKYMIPVVEREMKEERRQKNRETMQVLVNCVFTIVMIIAVSVAVHSMPQWLPTVVESLQYYGVIQPPQTPLPHDVMIVS